MADAPDHDTPTTDVDPAMPYEDARDELRAIVSRLERGDLSLEESLSLWERGEALAQHCERKLAGAKQRLDAALAQDAADQDATNQDAADQDATNHDATDAPESSDRRK